MAQRAKALGRDNTWQSCVQAGGHIGIVPTLLAGHFRTVYTFEPEVRNFCCLQLNVPANVQAKRAFLGEDNLPRRLLTHGKSSGGHQTGPVGGDIPTVRIDDLGLTDCEAIFLDIEGYEMYALRGASKTIARCQPILVLEENRKAGGYGRRPGELAAKLKDRYKQIDTIDEDIVLCPI